MTWSFFILFPYLFFHIFFIYFIGKKFVILGDDSFSIVDRIHPVGAGVLEVHGDASATEVEIEVSTEKPLLTEEQLKTW